MSEAQGAPYIAGRGGKTVDVGQLQSALDEVYRRIATQEVGPKPLRAEAALTTDINFQSGVTKVLDFDKQYVRANRGLVCIVSGGRYYNGSGVTQYPQWRLHRDGAAIGTLGPMVAGDEGAPTGRTLFMGTSVLVVPVSVRGDAFYSVREVTAAGDNSGSTKVLGSGNYPMTGVLLEL